MHDQRIRDFEIALMRCELRRPLLLFTGAALASGGFWVGLAVLAVDLI